jgi:hypothetical protein
LFATYSAQIPARQVESFLRTVARNGENTGASLAKAEDKARRRVNARSHANPCA